MLVVANEQVRNTLAKHGEAVRLKAGTILLREGKPSTGIYLVVSGTIETTVSLTKKRLATTGSLLGVPATVNGTSYSMSATVVEDAELIHVSRHSLVELMRSDAAVAFGVIEILSTEVREMRMHLKAPRPRSLFAK